MTAPSSAPSNLPPQPFFDSIDFMQNPFRFHLQDVSQWLGESPPAALADFQIASQFLFHYRGSPDTFNTYRREIEHFLGWCWIIRRTPLSQISQLDFEAYVDFARHPPKDWIGRSIVRRFIVLENIRIPNPDWRPYVTTSCEYSLSQSSLRSLFAVLSSFFNFLIQENHATANPTSRARLKSRYLRSRQEQRQNRRLSKLQWDFVIKAATTMAAENPYKHERTLFIISALFAMYLRISELVDTPLWRPLMGHFQRDQDGKWWFFTVGKGNKEREIAVSDEMLDALKRYRISRGLGPLPSHGESVPLIHKLNSSGAVTSSRHIRHLVQECFDRAALLMVENGLHQKSERLAVATVHWLRHTGISEDVKHRPCEHVRDDAGHSSIATTDLYIDVERSERHASARNKSLYAQVATHPK